MSSQNQTTNMNTVKTSARKLRKVKPSANNIASLLVFLPNRLDLAQSSVVRRPWLQRSASSAQLQYIAPDLMSSRRCTNCFARNRESTWYARVAARQMEKEHREAEAFLAPNIACSRRTNERPATAFQTNGDFGAVPSADRGSSKRP